MLEERTDITAIRAMAVADWEEVAVFQAHYMRVGHICILIDFVWIMSRYDTFGSKRKLRDNIHDLLLFLHPFSSWLLPLICISTLLTRRCRWHLRSIRRFQVTILASTAFFILRECWDVRLLWGGPTIGLLFRKFLVWAISCDLWVEVLVTVVSLRLWVLWLASSVSRWSELLL